MNKLSKLIMVLLAATLYSCCESDPENLPTAIIPKPTEMVIGESGFKFGKSVNIVASCDKALPSANFLKDLFEKSSNKNVEITTGSSQKNSVNLVIDDSFVSSSNEGYSLTITPDAVTITAKENIGIFYGVQSLRQLMPASIESDKKLAENDSFFVKSVTINDQPRFAWRGYMKDVSRTFYGVDVIKKYLDVMALYKMNVFHFHLTDDQGWRIEIKRYPNLTSEQTTIYPDRYNQPAERSGFYTQEQIKDLVKYAADRGITVVPEIDVPGHSWATLLVHPELGINNNHTPSHVFPFLDSWGHWGNQFTPNSLDPTKEVVYEFLDGVFTEVAELFPSEYIHFGGDEVMHKFWLAEPHVKTFMRKNKMKDAHDLQNYFVERVTKIITSKGRKPIGWNDVLVNDNLTKETAIMCWLGEDAIVKAAEGGYYSVATPAYPLYFDITQADRNDGTMCDLNYGVINTLQAAYEYNPTQGVSDENKKYVLGVQANIWPAVPQEVKDINVQNFPRLFAVAEIGWSSEEGKDFAEFNLRVDEAKKRLDVLKIDYYREGGYIADTWKSTDISDSYQTKEWDVTSKVYTSGRAIAGFYMTKGENNLNIEWVELLEDGKVISTDKHEGVSKVKKNIFRPYNYNLEVKSYNPDAKYSIRASIKGDGGNDSEGNITFNLSPYKPFTVVEPK